MAKKKQKGTHKRSAKVGTRQASLVVATPTHETPAPDPGVTGGSAAPARARFHTLETDRSRVSTRQLEKVIKNLEHAAAETSGLSPETQATGAALIADAKDLLQRMTAYWTAVLQAVRGTEE